MNQARTLQRFPLIVALGWAAATTAFAADQYPGADWDKTASQAATAVEARPRTEIKVASKLLDKYVGQYQFGPDALATVVRGGDRLFVRFRSGNADEIFPESNRDFFFKIVATQITFASDEHGQTTGFVLHQNGRDTPAKRLDGADIPKLMSAGNVPGLSMAVIRDGKIVRVAAFGLRNVAANLPIDDHTIFNVASLSKPVFAYAVLQLVDEGKLSLDEPLSTYLPDYAANDPRVSKITARQVLSHTSGLPNQVNAGHPLKTYFEPGDRFSYSGEGFRYLQKVIEKITGEDLDAVMKRLVFDPLQMRESSYVWQQRFEADYAEPYDGATKLATKRRNTAALSFSSLQTTAADYARFLQAVLSGTRLKRETVREWFQPQIKLTKQCDQCLEPDSRDLPVNLAWALGWGLEPGAGTFFHWGDVNQFKAFTIGSIRDRSAIVVLTNGSTGLSIMPALIHSLMPGERPVFVWLNY